MKSRFHAFVSGAAMLAVACAAAGASRSLAQAPPVFPGSEFSFSVGYFQPSGDSDVWRGNSQYLTLDTSDFDGAVWGAAFATHLSPNFDFQVTGQFYGATANVAYRSFVDEFGYPFEQNHTFTEFPIDLSFKFLPLPRMTAGGQKGGGVLRSIVPYFGGGIGAVIWDYTAEGWFVDDLVFPSMAYYEQRSSGGIAPSIHALAGLEIECSPWVAIWFEARYRWAQASLGGDFAYGPQDLDLGGGSLSVGTSFRF